MAAGTGAGMTAGVRGAAEVATGGARPPMTPAGYEVQCQQPLQSRALLNGHCSGWEVLKQAEQLDE